MLTKTKNTTVTGRSEIEDENGVKQTIASMHANHGENGELSIHVDVVSPVLFKTARTDAEADILEFVENAITES